MTLNHGENFKETFKNKKFNAAALNAGIAIAIQATTEAEKQNNLPHNAFTIANTDTTCTLFLFLDDFSDQDAPDYVLFPSQQITVNLDDGITFNTLWIKNTHAANNIAAKAIKYRISTIKKVN